MRTLEGARLPRLKRCFVLMEMPAPTLQSINFGGIKWQRAPRALLPNWTGRLRWRKKEI